MDELNTMLDRDELFQRCLGDTAFTLQMLAVFCDTAPKTLAALKDAADAGDLIAAQRHAHTLKGSAANLAIEKLRVQAEEIEMLAGQKDRSTLQQGVNDLEMCFTRSIVAAESYASALRAQ